MEREVSTKAGLSKECFETGICFRVAVAKATHNEIPSRPYKSAAMHLRKGYARIYDNTKHLLDS